MKQAGDSIYGNKKLETSYTKSFERSQSTFRAFIFVITSFFKPHKQFTILKNGRDFFLLLFSFFPIKQVKVFLGHTKLNTSVGSTISLFLHFLETGVSLIQSEAGALGTQTSYTLAIKGYDPRFLQVITLSLTQALLVLNSQCFTQHITHEKQVKSQHQHDTQQYAKTPKAPKFQNVENLKKKKNPGIFKFSKI